ncbi:MAG: serine acetyltransferase [Anaerofustis stercorihominis]|nr:serine acetyltransferase [Anaerofustis stercorihominis]
MNRNNKIFDTQQTAKKLQEINLSQFTPSAGILAMKKKVYKFIENIQCAIFPSIYEEQYDNLELMHSKIEVRLLEAFMLLDSLIKEAFRQSDKEVDSERIASEFFDELTSVRELLTLDVQAAYDGDPAAKSYEEVILSYPCMEAIMIYRLAHILWDKKVPLIPRIMTEYAHSNTGIDIHPGAKIGHHFFIDHGTGVVIGETTVIGNNVKLYQGVTLGARSFDVDEKGTILANKRHPNIEDNVIIYSGASILGGDTTVGHDSIIGGNVWLTHSVEPYSKVYNSTPSPYIKNTDKTKSV